ncbi:MAG: ATP-grasp domain-containing protein [Planctomycetes bacterium]|nr:ATP-grasp domain-containing protein [Planctomycetota bacterium]
MNVLFLSPGYPSEMVWFAEGLAAVGARVFGVGEAPVATLPERARRALTAYHQVPSLWDEDRAVAEIVREAKGKGVRFDRVESPWEPMVLLAARLREALGVPGMTVAQTVPFRDKEVMKQVLDAAGIRTPRHARCRTADEIRAAAQHVGFPLIVKPIAGAGSADTHRVDDVAQLETVIALTQHVPEVSVEEFIEGEEFTFDTICAGGRIAYDNICWYRPRPLLARTLQWVSPQTMALRDVDAPKLAGGRAMGHAVIEALRYTSGYTHMEWFLKPDGEVVFGEIGCRPPGARTVDIMNYACDFDAYRGWAEAVCYQRFSQPIERRYNAATVFKRAQGEGRISRIEGLQSLLHRYGPHIVQVELLPVGAHRRNWKATLMSDGHLIVRHPDLATCCEIADRVGTDLQMYAS